MPSRNTHLRPMFLCAILLFAFAAQIFAATTPQQSVPPESIVGFPALEAPCTLHVRLDQLYPLPASIKDLPQVVTNFGDPAHDGNVSHGVFNSAHFYPLPGTFTITTTINGVLAAKSTITIKPNMRSIVYISTSTGNDANPGTSARPFKTLAAAIKSKTATPKGGQPQVNNVEFLMKHGDQFPWTAGPSTQLHNCVIADFGNTALSRPVFWFTGPCGPSERFAVTLPAGSTDVVFQNVVFDSQYLCQPTTRPAKTPPANTNPTESNAVADDGAFNVTLVGSRFKNIDYGLTIQGNAQCALLLDCDAPQEQTNGTILPLHADDTISAAVSGIRCYTLYCAAYTQAAYIVVTNQQSANSTREHILRFDGGSHCLVEGCDLTNLDRTKIDSQDIAKSTIVFHSGQFQCAENDTCRTGGVGGGPINIDEASQFTEDAGQSLAWVVYDGCTITNAPFIADPGVTHILLRNSSITFANGNAVLINGYDNFYHRGVSDAVVSGCHIVCTGTQGAAVQLSASDRLYPPPTGMNLATGICLTNNTCSMPKAAFGVDGSCNVYVAEPNLRSFALVSGNTWAAPASYDRHSPNCGFWINGKFATLATWNGMGARDGVAAP